MNYGAEWLIARLAEYMRAAGCTSVINSDGEEMPVEEWLRTDEARSAAAEYLRKSAASPTSKSIVRRRRIQQGKDPLTGQ